MKKLSPGKKLLLAGSILTLAVACQSKPVRQPTQPAQSLHSDTEEQGEDDDEGAWDQTEPFKTEEKQMKAVSAPAPVEPVKPEAPKAAVAAPAEQPSAPMVEVKSAPAAATVVETTAPAPAAPVAEITPAASAAPVAETKAPAAPEEKQTVTTPEVAEKSAVSENVTPAKTAP